MTSSARKAYRTLELGGQNPDYHLDRHSVLQLKNMAKVDPMEAAELTHMPKYITGNK